MEKIETFGVEIPNIFNKFKIKKVLFTYDSCPMTLIFEQDNNLYLSHWCDQDADSIKYIVVAFSDHLLKELMFRKLTIFDALQQEPRYLVYCDNNGKVTNVYQVSEVPESFMPKQGVFI